MQNRKLLFLCCSAVFLLTSCAAKGISDKAYSDGRSLSDYVKETEEEDLAKTTKISADTHRSVATEPKLSESQYRSYMDYAVSLFTSAYNSREEKDGNVFISPASAYLALGMAVNGADGETEKEMSRVLCSGKTSDANSISKYLVDKSLFLSKSQEVTLNIADSIWYDSTDNLRLSSDFIEANKTYMADIYTANLSYAVDDINDWISKKTSGKIPKMVDEIDENIKAILINTIFFSDQWYDVYPDSAIVSDTFSGVSGKTSVEMMESLEKAYFSDDDTVGFIKKFREGYSFVAFLPNADINIDDYIKGLTSEKISSLLKNTTYNYVVDAHIPSFSFDYSTELSEALKDMGMKKCFTKDADFSKIFEENYDTFYIDKILQKTRVEVNRHGSSAAAATVANYSNGTTPATEYKTRKVYLDRPFVFMIVDSSGLGEDNCIPLFIGAVKKV